MLKTRVPLWSVVLFLGFCSGFALAARNSGGSYSLPAGNPVVTGTTITSTWANNTLNDIKTEITNSLDRQGRGGMSAPLQLASGTASAPGLTFSAEPTSGLYRAGAGDLRASVLTIPVLKLQTTLVSSLVPLTVTGRTTTTDLTVTGQSDTLSISASAANMPGLVSSGNGTGYGVLGGGGTTNGIGVLGIGGGTTGIGVSATGGSTTGIGLVAQGGASAGTGATLLGGAGGVGVIASAGTAATAAVPQDAIQASNGYISLDGVAAPNGIGFGSHGISKNRIHPKNITQAWASVLVGGSTAVEDSYGVASVSEVNPTSCTGFYVEVVFDASFAVNGSFDPMYAAIVGAATPNALGGGTCRPLVASRLAGSVRIQFMDANGYFCTRMTGCGAGITEIANTGFEIAVIGAQ
jgi:hypothetical protein